MDSHAAEPARPVSAFTHYWRSPRSRWLRGLLSLAFVALAGWLLWRQLSTMSWSAFVQALEATSPWAVAASIVLTVLSYIGLSGTEWFAIRLLGQRLSFRRAAMVAVPSYALTNSAGFSPATGTAFRVQLYGRYGISPGRSAAIAMLAGAAVTISGLVTAGLVMLMDPASVAAVVHARWWQAMLVGAALTAPAVLWFHAFTRKAPRWLGGRWPAPISLWGRTFALAAGVGDWLFSCAALFVLLPHPDASVFPAYLTAYIAGSLLSAATGIPGGIGIFEAIVLALTAVMTQVQDSAVALLLYRCIYSLGPLTLWGVVALVRAVRRRRRGPDNEKAAAADAPAARSPSKPD